MEHKLTERDILNKIYSLAMGQKDKNLVVGPGDDCAVVKISKNKSLVITTDGLVEGTHFISHKNNAKNLAQKLIRSNLSDFAGMGDIKVLSAVCAVGLPAGISGTWVNIFAKELFNEAKKFNLTISGGNITKSKTMHLYLTVFGTADSKKIIKRSTAVSGDLIYAVGNFGHSRAGTELIKKKSVKFKTLTNDFWRPKICMREAKVLSQNALASAMADNSDGLYESVKILAESSGIGANIEPVEKLISPALKEYCKFYRKNPKEYVLFGGEDYGLVFAVSPKNEKKLIKLLPKIRRVGKFLKKKGVTSDEFSKNKTFLHF